MKKSLLTMVSLSGCFVLHAQEAPFQASLTPDIAVHSSATVINGLSLNIWGQNPQHGVTFGLVNGSTGDSSGFTWGLVNYSEHYKGVSWGFVNYSQDSFRSWQGGYFLTPCILNISQGEFTGFQEGVVNFAQDFHGFQLGFLNYAQNLDGLQIGLINIAANNPWFDEFPDRLATGFPIVNWSF